MRADARLDGHLVAGHVDGVGRVARFEPVGESWALEVEAPARWRASSRSRARSRSTASASPSTASRTAPAGCAIGINLIPHTVQNTSLRGLAVGGRVNLEIDLIARYVERMLGMTSRPA